MKTGVWLPRVLLLIVAPDSQAQRARCQAETPLIALCRIPGPALSVAASRGITLCRIPDETIFACRESRPENKSGLAFAHWTRRDSVMWAFINALYRDYCLARLQETRKLELAN